MKKLLLLSLFFCITTQTQGALPYLRIQAMALQAGLKRIAFRNLTTTTPARKTITDTLWQTKEGKIVRVMGDMHIPTPLPYAQLLEHSFQEIDKTNHQTTVVIEGGFNESTDALRTEEESKKAKLYAITALNTVAQTASFKTVEIGLTKVRVLPEFATFLQCFPLVNSLATLVDNEQWRAVLTPTLVTRFKKYFLNESFFQNFNAHTIEKIETHLKEFASTLETTIKEQNNEYITTIFTPLMQQIHQFLFALHHLKNIDMKPTEQLMHKHFLTLTAATLVEIGTEIKKALLPQKAHAQACAALITAPSSLWIVLEDIEVLIHILTATQAHKNIITYNGALHSINVNSMLKNLEFTKIKHDGPTKWDTTKVPCYGLNEETIKANNALFLKLIQLS